MKKYLSMTAILWLVSHSAFATISFANGSPQGVMQFLQGHSMVVYLSAFFGLGILLAFTPCVLPMVPILSGVIVGQKQLSTAHAFKLSLSYVLGMALTYALAGMAAGLMGSTIQTLMQTPWVIISFSLVFAIMALSMFGLFEFRLPSHLSSRLSHYHQPGKRNYFSVALMGVISTLVVSPCVTAPLVGVLTYIGQQGEVLTGGLILFVMALGMGLPLLLVGTGYGSLLPKAGVWMVKIKQVFAFMMLAMAIWLLARILPETIIHLLSAALLIGVSISLGAFKTTAQKAAKLFKVIGLGVFIVSGVVTYNTVAAQLIPSSAKSINKMSSFIVVHSQAELNQQLSKAKALHKIAFVEFFAAWCSDCQAMDAHVFNQADIQKAMQGLVNIRVDISDNTPAVLAIKKHYGIYGVPTMMFFDEHGKRLAKLYSVGLIDKAKMQALLAEAKH